jgi:thiol-disulfide isomerase/thioredoxin
VAGVAVAMGVFHGILKEPPQGAEVARLSSAVLRATRWQGRYPADFSAHLLAGGEFHLADTVGRRVLLLNFFATWCEPCRAEMPELQRFLEAHRGEALTAVFVDAGEPEADVRRFAAQFGIDAPVALDPEKAIGNRFGVDSYPTTVLVGADGKIALYETSPIVNADVELEPLYRVAKNRLARGAGISHDQYLAALAAQRPFDDQPTAATPKLGERQARLAAAMPCPCSCGKQVLACGCQTATKIQEKLASMPITGKSDEEVVAALDREFCVGASLARSR